jgi:hypothetical protein
VDVEAPDVPPVVPPPPVEADAEAPPPLFSTVTSPTFHVPPTSVRSVTICSSSAAGDCILLLT